jgi:hypothetical protein
VLQTIVEPRIFKVQKGPLFSQSPCQNYGPLIEDGLVLKMVLHAELKQKNFEVQKRT